MLTTRIQASSNSETPATLERRERRAMLLLLLVALLVIATLFYYVQTVQASYSCSSFCHGVIVWPGSVTGAQTQDEVVNLTCQPAACKPGSTTPVPHIGNVLWVLDTSSSGCPQGACWIEAGYHTVTNSGGTSTVNQYYWAAWRPGDTKLNVHPLTNVVSGDLGGNVLLEIYAQTSTQWQIIVSPNQGLWSGLSTGNNMHGNQIQIGMELAGTSGASAPYGYFINNQWQNGIGGAWNYQSVSGTHHNDPPINSNWLYPPAGSSNNGGTYGDGCTC